jgi:predicted O-methyltransferase YrrM
VISAAELDIVETLATSTDTPLPDISCYDDVCIRSDEGYPSIWFSDRKDIFACAEPYALCDVGQLAYDFCTNAMNVTGYYRSVCAHNMWRMYALKEHMILKSKFDTSSPTNRLGFTRSNDWFEVTLYLPGILSKQLISSLGEEFLLARPLKLLEIGSYEGGSSVWYIRYMLTHPQSTLTCIDPWSSDLRNGLNSSLVYDTFQANIALTGRSDRVRVLRNDSMLALANLVVHGEKFDFIYVDGSHMLPDVLSDITLSWKLLAVGGVMALDDVPWRSTRKIASDAVDKYTYSPIGDRENSPYPYCHTVGNRSEYLLEDSITALLTHLPGCDVLYCGYHVAVKKVF